ncbi:hypothetical protein [Halomontanus rarus]|uniref:hypothetical protein n=1 Tax=Halomontanus rarus TaxID=3034020 RepID=UPI0023E79C68|nr:hypothetical protein [Halovivax sp. TS33]
MSNRHKSITDRIVQPNYTGENRCLPCTIVNLSIAIVLSLAIGIVAPMVGAFILILSIVLIWLRGYLIPGTPGLTKRYFPDWILERFDHSSLTEIDDLDIETYLIEVGVIVDDPAESDVVLNLNFETMWEENVVDLQEATADRDALSRFTGVSPDDLVFQWYDTAFVAHLDDEWIGQWESRSAFIADMAASRTMGEWDPRWRSIPLAQRSEILGALRIFLERCPTCDGEVTFEQEVVESCCQRYNVIASTCSDCDDRLLETRV